MKRPFVVLAAAFGAAALSAAAPSLVKKWETEPTLKVPESVLVDARRGILYVSNIDGEPWADDQKGSIGKLGFDGKVIATDWVNGLSAPKGMALQGSKLYVGDIDRVVVVDVEKGAIVDRIPVAGAHGLNDVAVDAKGVVYVSDSKDKKIYTITDGKAAVLVDGLKGPNGVHVYDGQFYFLDNGSLYRLGKNHEKQLVSAGMEGNGDGLESDGKGGFVITYWPGIIHYAGADGSRETLLDTSKEKISSADIGFDAKTRTVYVPTFGRNTVVAYELK
ncbi:MAG TPA: ATP/GTP-binding protein [Lacunisphaera sp.]|nr:ATP/GTP-binding protein [Lacunisphaera sp.]